MFYYKEIMLKLSYFVLYNGTLNLMCTKLKQMQRAWL